MQTETLTIEQCRQLAGIVSNRQRLSKDDRESIRSALLELADRKEEFMYGVCWNCTKRGTCNHFAKDQKYALVCNFCAHHCGDWRH